MKPIFSVDWEPFFCLDPYNGKNWKEDPLVEEPTLYLLDLLRRHQIKAIFFCLGWLVDNRQDLYLKIRQEGHVLGYHSRFHHKSEADYGNYMRSIEPNEYPQPFRSPKFRGQKRLYGGGAFLRAIPYWMLKKLVLKEGFFYVHPHDLLWEHPELPNPWHNFKRQIGLKTSRDKLERLTREVEFADATDVYKSS